MLSLKASLFCLAWISSVVDVVVMAYPATWEMNYTSVDTDMMGYMTLPGSLQVMDDSTDSSAFPENGLPAVVIVPVRIVWFGLVWFGLVQWCRFDSIRFDSIRLELV